MNKLQRNMVRFKGLTLGLDLHKKMIQYCVFDEAGDERGNEKMPADAASLHRLLDKLTKDGQAVQVVLEASGCFVWAYDLLAKRLGKERVHVAPPGAPSKVRVIAEAGEKTDETDAWWLACLQYWGAARPLHDPARQRPVPARPMCRIDGHWRRRARATR